MKRILSSTIFNTSRRRLLHAKPLAPGMIKASDLMVKCLENEGITHIFGVPGEENADFMMSLKSSNINFVLTRHEQGAAFMAEVFGRLSGQPAVCLATLGPGATNLITGVANCNMDRAPMLVITGQGSTDRRHKESHQIIDVIAMYQPVTKWANSILHPDNIPEVIRKAVRLARTEKPGACLIELCEDIAKLGTTAKPMQVRRFKRPGPDNQIILEAYKKIKAAKHPVIIAGNGTVRKGSSEQLRRFSKATGIGVISTFMGKGCVSRQDENCLFTIGLGAKDYPAHLLDKCDLVITCGYDLVEYHPRLWNSDGSKHVIDIDFVPADIDSNYHPEVECVGDIGHTLYELNRLVEQDKPTWNLPLQKNVREIMLKDFRQHAEDDTDGYIRPQKALWDVREVLGPHDILLSGVGAHKMWIGRYYHCDEPNTCLIPNGFCSMGLPLPGSIAASIVYPERKIFGLCGDGDFLMNVQEMETARRMNSNITIMVWEDGGYGLISWKQDNEFGTHTDLAFGNPNWKDLAKAFGWTCEHVTKSRDLKAALHRAVNHQGPSLVVIPIDYRENILLTDRLAKINPSDILKP